MFYDASTGLHNHNSRQKKEKYNNNQALVSKFWIQLWVPKNKKSTLLHQPLVTCNDFVQK